MESLRKPCQAAALKRECRQYVEKPSAAHPATVNPDAASLTHKQLQQRSEDVGPEHGLLVLCLAFRSRGDYPNLTVKKIPKQVLSRCEWEHDDCSQQVCRKSRPNRGSRRWIHDELWEDWQSSGLHPGNRTEGTAMNKATILNLLHRHRDDFTRRFGARYLALFGSAARDELHDDSDVDILVEFEGPATFDGYMDLKFFLESLLGRQVDLVTEKGLRKEIRPNVEREAVRVA